MNQKLPFQDTVYMEITKPVSTFGIFAKGLWRSLFRTQGVLAHKTPKQIIVNMKAVQPKPEQVNLYRMVCGYPLESENLPTPFPETLFISPLGKLVTSHAFPLSPMGLIHVGQDIKQVKPLPINSLLDLCCKMTELSETKRGFRLNVSLEARVDGELVWEGVAKFLSRFQNTIKGRNRQKRVIESKISEETEAYIEIPKDTGLQYAKASGDYNPHHLYGVTAKPLGYKRPIAHGMWSLAKSLAEIEKHTPTTFPYSVHAYFKLPIYMPGTVTLSWEHHKNNKTILFAMKNAKNKQPHVNGTLGMGTA